MTLARRGYDAATARAPDGAYDVELDPDLDPNDADPTTPGVTYSDSRVSGTAITPGADLDFRIRRALRLAGTMP